MNSNKQAKLHRPSKFRLRHLFVNAFVLFALVASTLPANVAQAASVRQQDEPSDSQIYLPLVANGQVGGTTLPDPGDFNARRFDYKAGHTYTYEWNLTLFTESMNRSGDETKTGQNEMRLHAFADIAIQNSLSDGTTVAQLRVHDLTVQNVDENGETAPVEDPELAEELKTPLVFHQTTTGEISAVSYPADASANAINLQKGLVNALQVVLQDSDEYTVEETGGQGSYAANYIIAEETNKLNVATKLYITKSFNQNDFTQLLSAGDENNDLKLDNSVNIIFDQNQGVITSVEVNENIVSSSETETDGLVTGDGPEGIAVWSGIRTAGSLKLVGRFPTSPLLAASINTANYVSGGLGADLSDSSVRDHTLNLDDIELETELDAIEENPEDPAVISRVAHILETDQSGTVLGMVVQRLGSDKSDEVLGAYIDAMATVPTTTTQQILSTILVTPTVRAASMNALQSADFSDTLKERLLIHATLLDAPEPSLLDAVESLSLDLENSIQEQAVSTLGAMAHSVADEDPERSSAIVAGFVSQLNAADDDVQTELYLHAIGNAGSDEAVGAIAAHLDDDSSIVQVAALQALRKVDTDEAEAAIVASLQSDAEDIVRDAAAATLMERGVEEGSAAAAALELYNAAPLALNGVWRKDWDKRLGGRKIGVTLPGNIYVSSPPKTSALYLDANQYAYAHAWSYKYRLFRARLLSYQKNRTQRHVGAYVWVGGNSIYRKYETTVPCNVNRSGTLVNQSVQIFRLNTTIPIYWVLSVNLEAKGRGYFRVKYNYMHRVCNSNSALVEGTITPEAWASASGGAYASLIALRGGATLDADLLRGSIPAKVSALVTQSGNNAPQLKACIDVRAKFQALKGSVRLVAEHRIKKGSWWKFWSGWTWKEFLSKKIFSFDTPSKNYELLVRCSR